MLMVRQYKPSIPETIGELYILLGFMMIKAPTFEDPIFPGRNVEAIFFELNEGLSVVREEVGEERFRVLTELSDRMRRHFEADPNDSNGETRKGRKLIPEMEAILLGSLKPVTYPPMNRVEMIGLARRLREQDGDPRELDIVSDRLLVALPHGDVMALLFNDPDLPVEEAIDEAIRRENEATGSQST
jgi:hypothetical protein